MATIEPYDAGYEERLNAMLAEAFEYGGRPVTAEEADAARVE